MQALLPFPAPPSERPGELARRLQNGHIGNKHKSIRHFKYEKGTGAEIRCAVVSGIVNAPVSYWLIFVPVLRNSPRSLFDSDQFSSLF